MERCLLPRCFRSEIFYIPGNSYHNSSRNADDQADLKTGTKLGLGYIVKKATKVMKVEYLIADNDDKAYSMDNFVTVLELQ